MRHFRAYRFARAAVTIFVTALRYLWLRFRERWPVLRPSELAWQRAHARTGRAIYRLTTRMGGAFIKLGQILGSRADVLPPPLIEPLRGLHDRVPPRPLARLRPHLERELGRPIEEVFAEIEPEALAAASLAQVHRARLVGGEPVVVKIQYPEARRLFPVDLRSLRRAARVARWVNRDLDLRPVANELADLVVLELDFAREAESTERVRANLDPLRVGVPKVHRELSTDRVLVLEQLDGTPLSALEELRSRGVDLRDVGRRVAALYAEMIFEHGFFQGDPHPGNLMVLDDGRIGLLDFGLATELPEGFADHAAAMFAAAAAGDELAAARAARAVGFALSDSGAADLVSMVRSLLGDVSQGKRILAVLRGGELEVPPHFALIGRVMVILAGVSHTLAPGERVIPGALLGALAPRLAARAQSSRAEA